MPGLIRKITVIAAIDGLILQPSHHQKGQKAVHIEYKTNKISSRQPGPAQQEICLESHGIVGLLTLPSLAYVVAITGRQQVANLRGFSVFAINDIALIPCSSNREASLAVAEANASRKTSPGVDSDSEQSSEDETSGTNVRDDGSVKSDAAQGDQVLQPNDASESNVAKDVIGNQGRYGRFAERWFSKKGWVAERRMTQGMSADGAARSKDQDDNDGSDKSDIATEAASRRKNFLKFEGQQLPFLPKFLRTTRMLLCSGSFYFSYDVDISRRVEKWDMSKSTSDLLIDASFDPLFFWNRNLTKVFRDRDHHAYVLPIMQGFIGQREFLLSKDSKTGEVSIPSGGTLEEVYSDQQSQQRYAQAPEQLLLTLVSRRSVERPGLRYLRRGIDDEGNAANFVETEQILSDKDWNLTKTIFSFAQIRGSIPLFFSQSPYSFKPVPVLQHSEEINRSAYKQHFEKLLERYGDVQIVLLTDKTGPEGTIGQKYQAITESVNNNDGIRGRQLSFNWFDFHAKCSGMRFDNVQLLIDDIRQALNAFGYSTVTNGNAESRQSGIIRTNCMDCLDRTNVVQSGFGQKMLEDQLKTKGFDIDLRNDVSTQWFNSLWADNGDAISKQYSSTAALKSDYTRTRKRTYRGAVNDLSLTLSRYYNNIVNDFFSQTVIDFLLGHVNARVFDDFEENLMSRDPAMSLRKVRDNAINTSAKIVIADENEELTAGWALLSPTEPDTIRQLPLEECILLLTEVALYKVYFDWAIEKVSSFERVDLRSISSIIKGTYVTSTLTSAQTDEDINVGFVTQYRPGTTNITRVNTRSLSTAAGLNEIASGTQDDSASSKGEQPLGGQNAKFLAFKAPSTRSSMTSDEHESKPLSERQLVDSICHEISRAGKVSTGSSENAFDVEEADIVSAKEARDSTGMIEHWTHSLKRMVWG